MFQLNILVIILFVNMWTIFAAPVEDVIRRKSEFTVNAYESNLILEPRGVSEKLPYDKSLLYQMCGTRTGNLAQKTCVVDFAKALYPDKFTRSGTSTNVTISATTACMKKEIGLPVDTQASIVGTIGDMMCALCQLNNDQTCIAIYCVA